MGKRVQCTVNVQRVCMCVWGGGLGGKGGGRCVGVRVCVL